MSKSKEQHGTWVATLRRGHETIVKVARCSCGWESRYCTSESEAENEATGHVVAVTRGEP